VPAALTPDNQPTTWYEAAQKVAMDKAANEAFQAHHTLTVLAAVKQAQIKPLNPQPTPLPMTRNDTTKDV
jgi:hypothetical protein